MPRRVRRVHDVTLDIRVAVQALWITQAAVVDCVGAQKSADDGVVVAGVEVHDPADARLDALAGEGLVGGHTATG